MSKQYLTSFLSLFLAASVFLFIPGKAEATKSTEWNSGVINLMLHYIGAYRGSTIWYKGLDNFHVKVDYFARITNVDTQEVVTDGSTVPEGTKLKLEFIPHERSHVFWNGTGYTSDTPYGHWIINAGPPTPEIPNLEQLPNFIGNTCDASDRIANRHWIPLNFIFALKPDDDYGFSVYIPLSINPPDKQITNLNGLNCGNLINGVMECTVTGTDTVSPTFRFENTEGRFYYRYRLFGEWSGVFDNKCLGQNHPMRTGDREEFTLRVPAREISYNINVEQASTDGTPPNSPTITCLNCEGKDPDTGYDIGYVLESTDDEPYRFAIQADHPDNREIRYLINWTNDGGFNEITKPYVSSGTEVVVSKSWPVTGLHTFCAAAQDRASAMSNCVEHNIIIKERSVEEALPDLTANVPHRMSCIVGQQMNISGNILNMGQGDAGPSVATFRVMRGDDDPLQTTFVDTPVLPADRSASVSTSWVPDQAGSYILGLCADANNDVQESNEENNCYSRTFSCVEREIDERDRHRPGPIMENP